MRTSALVFAAFASTSLGQLFTFSNTTTTLLGTGHGTGSLSTISSTTSTDSSSSSSSTSQSSSSSASHDDGASTSSTSSSSSSVPLGSGPSTSLSSSSSTSQANSSTSVTNSVPLGTGITTTSLSSSSTSSSSGTNVPPGDTSGLPSITAPPPTSTSTASSTGPITSTMTTVPTGVSTEIIHPTGITTNAWITTTKDSSTTIVPAIWCTSCAPNGGDGLVIIWNFPPIPRVNFDWSSVFPKLPEFNLPCIKVLDVQIAGDCPNPQTEDNNDGDDGDNSSSSTSSTTETSSTSSSSQSCTQSTTVSDCRVGCSVSYTSTASSLSSTTVCYTTSCVQTVGCSLQPTTSSTVSTSSTSASACALTPAGAEYDAWATYSSLGISIPPWMQGATIPLPADTTTDSGSTTSESASASETVTSSSTTQNSSLIITSAPSTTTSSPFGCNTWIDFNSSDKTTSCLCGSIPVDPETVTSSGTTYLQCLATGVPLSTVYTFSSNASSTTIPTTTSSSATQTYTGSCYTDTSREQYGQCQWTGQSSIVQVGACPSSSACPSNGAACYFVDDGTALVGCGASSPNESPTPASASSTTSAVPSETCSPKTADGDGTFYLFREYMRGCDAALGLCSDTITSEGMSSKDGWTCDALIDLYWDNDMAPFQSGETPDTYTLDNTLSTCNTNALTFTKQCDGSYYVTPKDQGGSAVCTTKNLPESLSCTGDNEKATFAVDLVCVGSIC